jgi:hypothetical protein
MQYQCPQFLAEEARKGDLNKGKGKKRKGDQEEVQEGEHPRSLFGPSGQEWNLFGAAMVRDWGVSDARYKGAPVNTGTRYNEEYLTEEEEPDPKYRAVINSGIAMKLLYQGRNDNLLRVNLMRKPHDENIEFQRLCVQLNYIDWNVPPVVQIQAWLQAASLRVEVVHAVAPMFDDRDDAPSTMILKFKREVDAVQFVSGVNGKSIQYPMDNGCTVWSEAIRVCYASTPIVIRSKDPKCSAFGLKGIRMEGCFDHGRVMTTPFNDTLDAQSMVIPGVLRQWYNEKRQGISPIDQELSRIDIDVSQELMDQPAYCVRVKRNALAGAPKK